MKWQTLGPKRQFISNSFRNVDTVAVKKGGPVYYKAGGTILGFSGVSIEALATANQSLFAGIAMAEVAVNGFGDAFAYGIADPVRYISNSRSATDAVWPSQASFDIGALLTPVSNSNTEHVQAFIHAGNAVSPAIISYASNVTIPAVAAVNNLGYEMAVRLAQSVASIASEASNSDAADAAKLFRTTTVKAMIRTF